jgi:Na+-translocating ferredoxin:NAD+ oxidoreductase RnfD subunit
LVYFFKKKAVDTFFLFSQADCMLGTLLLEILVLPMRQASTYTQAALRGLLIGASLPNRI